MPQYRYQMKTPGGEQTTGTLSAENAMAAAQLLRSQGNTVQSLSPVGVNAAALGEKLKALNYTSGPSAKDVLNFTTQLAVMVRAGISLRAALEGIAEQTENAKFKQILFQIKQDVESGKPFSRRAQQAPETVRPAVRQHDPCVGDVRPVQPHARTHRRLPRTRDRDAAHGRRGHDLPGHHRLYGRGGVDVPAHVRAAQVRDGVRG